MNFLDLTDATDSEKRHIQQILYNSNHNPCLQLPYDVDEHRIKPTPPVRQHKSDEDHVDQDHSELRNGNHFNDSVPLADDSEPTTSATTPSSLSSGSTIENHSFIAQSPHHPHHHHQQQQQQQAISPLAFYPSSSPSKGNPLSSATSPHPHQHPNSGPMPQMQHIPYPIVTHIPVMSSSPMLRPTGAGIDVRNGVPVPGASPLIPAGPPAGLPFQFIGPNGAFIPSQSLPPVTATGFPVSGPANGFQQQMFPPFIPYPYFFVPSQPFPPQQIPDNRPLMPPHLIPEDAGQGQRDSRPPSSQTQAGGQRRRNNNRNNHYKNAVRNEPFSPSSPSSSSSSSMQQQNQQPQPQQQEQHPHPIHETQSSPSHNSVTPSEVRVSSNGCEARSSSSSSSSSVNKRSNKAEKALNGHPAAAQKQSGPKAWSSLFKSSSSSISNDCSSSSPSNMPPHQLHMYDRVCLGGTFDSIHDGHKRLLNESLSKCSEILTIGVTDESMIQKKVLWELIKPVDERIESVRKYCDEYLKQTGRTGVKLNIVPISDPFGPSITDATLKAIVVSDETMAGAVKINEIRKTSGMTPLEVISIRLIPSDHKESSLEEDKISSSTLRMRKLGTLIREPEPKPGIPTRPYLIGLTGGIASGKSSIAAEFQKLGAGVIDCDKMAHLTYQPGSPAYEKIVREFGHDVVDNVTSEIVRKKLGAKVFGNSAAKSKLESIVWPETTKLVFREADRLRLQEQKEVIIMEAAQLIEAKWSEKVHQVWVSMVPEDVAVKRVVERNSLSESEAIQRIKSQMSNRSRVSHANVVFCTVWDREYTRAQVQRAWNMLQKRFLRAV